MSMVEQALHDFLRQAVTIIRDDTDLGVGLACHALPHCNSAILLFLNPARARLARFR